MKYEWDENKNTANKKKHHVDFEDAVMVFADPYRIERYDRSANNTSGEDRWQTIGKVGQVLFVCYTERGDVTRLISARIATSQERRIYNGYRDSRSEDWTEAH